MLQAKCRRTDHKDPRDLHIEPEAIRDKMPRHSKKDRTGSTSRVSGGEEASRAERRAPEDTAL